MSEKTLSFKKEKETKNKIRFKEENDGSGPPLIETIYLPKWFAKDKTEVEIIVKIKDD